MDNARINLILGIALSLSCATLIALKAQDHTASVKTSHLAKDDPLRRWQLIRDEREKNLTEARKKGIPHEQIIIKKCDCTSIKTAQEKTKRTKDILENWKNNRCKNLCEATKSSAKTPQ